MILTFDSHCSSWIILVTTSLFLRLDSDCISNFVSQLCPIPAGMGPSPREKLEKFPGHQRKVVESWGAASATNGKSEGRVTPRQEGRFLLQCLGVSQSAFNTVIFVNAALGELFERKSLHLTTIREMLACQPLCMHGRTIFLFI